MKISYKVISCKLKITNIKFITNQHFYHHFENMRVNILRDLCSRTNCYSLKVEKVIASGIDAMTITFSQSIESQDIADVFQEAFPHFGVHLESVSN